MGQLTHYVWDWVHIALNEIKWPLDDGKWCIIFVCKTKSDYDRRVEMQDDSYTSVEDKREGIKKAEEDKPN